MRGRDRENGVKELADYSKRKSNQVKWTITGTRRDETFVQIICCGQARSAAVKFITLASDQWSWREDLTPHYVPGGLAAWPHPKKTTTRIDYRTTVVSGVTCVANTWEDPTASAISKKCQFRAAEPLFQKNGFSVRGKKYLQQFWTQRSINFPGLKFPLRGHTVSHFNPVYSF